MKKILLLLALNASAILAQTGAQGVSGPCSGRPLHTFVNATAAGTTLVIPAAAHNSQAQIIRVCQFQIVSAAALNIKLVGTLNAADTDITATNPSTSTWSWNWDGQLGTDTVGNGASLGINLSASGTVGITISYYYSVQ